jgi:hypothetical protein
MTPTTTRPTLAVAIPGTPSCRRQTVVRTDVLAAELLGAQHPRGAAHLVILAMIVIVALVLVGAKRLRGRRTSAAEQQPDSPDEKK